MNAIDTGRQANQQTGSRNLIPVSVVRLVVVLAVEGAILFVAAGRLDWVWGWAFLGTYLLVSNPNPAGRNPLCVAVSRDGLVFTALAALPIPGSPSSGFPARLPRQGMAPDTLQYPHAIEHDGHLLVVFSRNKRAVESVKVPLSAVEALLTAPVPYPERRREGD